LKLDPACKHVPVLLLVADTSEYDRPTKTIPPAEVLVSKPLTAHDLIQRVGKALMERTS
jgi:CheY-like chemotaxis protein